MRPRRERKDTNHHTILARFRFHGCSAVTLPASESGLPDALIGCARANHLVEIKSEGTRYGRAGASTVQREWAERWRGEEPAVASTVEQVDALVKQWRSEAAKEGGPVGHRENMKAAMKDRQANGLCVQCAKPNDRKDETAKNGRHARYCTACLEAKRAQEAQNRVKAQASIESMRAALGGKG